MKSFISEIENPLVQRDIIELGEKIRAFREGTVDEEKFRALRLARGVYGQRQPGVQMVRIKLPFGRVSAAQLFRIADVGDEFSTGKLHITTRQDIQIHYVKLDRTPEMWAALERDDVTIREACGNTVRNVTASALAGIDPDEVFDVSPYADLFYRYFLRKPFGQELGRKIKIAFSSGPKDDAFTFMHDFGFIAKMQEGVEGFKVMVGGGLGAQPFLAQTAFEFLPASEVIPFTEASIRVFDRYGERNSRHKARIKYLISAVGIEEFKLLVANELTAIQYNPAQDFVLEPAPLPFREIKTAPTVEALAATADDYKTWLRTNVIAQKQKGYFAAFLKVKLGDFSTDQARLLAEVVRLHAADDMRFTIDQSILLRFVSADQLHDLYQAVKAIGLGDSGYNSVADVTSCPGTDTCNLGISNSTQVARVIEQTIRDEYPDLIFSKDIKIKISGCMNSCGQHGLAHIGFHGSSMKVGQHTAPALQVLMGGGVLGDGFGRIADKVIKVPSKRVLDVIRFLIDDYEAESNGDESFHDYYDRQGKNYFYNLLKPLADTTHIEAEELVDWGQQVNFKPEIGTGECAGVMIDLVATLIYDAELKASWADESFEGKAYADALYHAYAAAIHIAKAVLLKQDVRCNTHHGIISDYDTHLYSHTPVAHFSSFKELVLQINQHQPSEAFAKKYLAEVNDFIGKAKAINTSNPQTTKSL
jgi:sulfite reductase (ferredoxin)